RGSPETRRGSLPAAAYFAFLKSLPIMNRRSGGDSVIVTVTRLEARSRRGRGCLRRLRTLGRDCRGGPIMEFALVAAPMVALMIATLETAFTYFAQDALETAAETAARSIMTGQA